jgi:hypothetical protein
MSAPGGAPFTTALVLQPLVRDVAIVIAPRAVLFQF